jgi:hypothetical protein
MLVLARPAAHMVIGERGRLVHCFEVPKQTPDRLQALCGALFGPGELEWVKRLLGMPCEACLALAAQRLEIL